MEDFDVVYGHKMNEAPKRRSDDKRIDSLIQAVDDHITETRRWRCDLKKELSQVRVEVSEFKKFGPMLQEALDRRNWFAKRWDEAKSELVKRGIQASVFATFAFLSWAIWHKFQNAVVAIIGAASK